MMFEVPFAMIYNFLYYIFPIWTTKKDGKDVIEIRVLSSCICFLLICGYRIVEGTLFLVGSHIRYRNMQRRNRMQTERDIEE